MAYYRDLHEWLEALEAKGFLNRIPRRIDKDTELHPLARLQFRGLPERARKGWLFENVTDARGKHYDIPVALAVMAPSRAVYALGMGVKSPEEIPAKWTQAQTHPIPPRVIDSPAPCHELVYQGRDLENAGGLGMLPVPISTPGFDSAPFFSSGHWVTKDPETGEFNFGTYRGQIKSPTRVGLFAFAYQDITKHWTKARALGKPLEAAIVVGCTPNLSYCSTSRLPSPEYPIAGAIAGEPVELARCKTVDILVPARSEIVIEGLIATDAVEPEGPFGEFTGYMAERAPDKFMTVTGITRRRDAVFQAFLSQFPPSESSVLRGVALEGLIYKILTVDNKMKGILEVALPDAGGSHGVGLIRVDRSAGLDPMAALEVIADMPRAAPKILIAVDADIDARNADAVQWAMSYRMQPHRDIRIRDIKVSTALDFSLAPPSSREEAATLRGSAILIDATRKWEYPPVSLPRKEFMDKAQAIWRELGLPALELKNPWYGYNLGSWSEEDQADAELALRGEHYAVGEMRAAQRAPFKEK